MEYDWKPDADYARAAFADAPLRRIWNGVTQVVPDTAPNRYRMRVRVERG